MQKLRFSHSLTPLLATLLAIGCGAAVPQSDQKPDDLNHNIRGMHYKHEGLKSAAAPAGAHLTYYGGRVNSATQVTVVLWGTGSYDSHIGSTATPSMMSFYNQVLSNGSYASWLDGEYNTVNPSGTKTNQHIGNGTVTGVVTITPSITSSTISDAQIQSELQAQINAGHLPAIAHDSAGNATNYYAVFFPHGKTITQGGSNSCQAGGFCAYHGTVGNPGATSEFYYGVHPDMQAGSGCDTGCGSASTAFGNYTSVASHELTEMITDAEVGDATVNGPPLAWYDSNNGEIGDICNAQQSNYVACDGQTYVLQQEFSNAQSNCINVPAPTSTNCSGGGGGTADFSISASSVSIQQGSSGSSSVSTSAVGSSGTVSLSLSGVPSGITATLGTTSVTAGSGTTISISVAASTAAGNYSFNVNGSEGTKSHSATVSVAVTSSGGGGGGGAIVNGDFETGSLSGWTASGAATSVSGSAHAGSYAAMLGSTSPTNGDSSIAQTFTAPSGATQLSFFYRVVCPDTLTYDWATATLKDNTSGTTATPLAKVCSNSGSWQQATAAVTAGHSYTLTLTSHDDNYASDPTYTLYDDVLLNGGGGGGGSTFSISGAITSSGSGLSGVSVTTSGASGTTSSSGAYTLSNLANGTYTVTPSLSGYTFSPASASVTVNGANVSGVNFTASSSGGGGGLLLSDGFETPSNWSQQEVAGTQGSWATGTSSVNPTASAHGGSRFAIFNSYDAASGSKTRLIHNATVALPSGVSTITLTFWMYHDTGYSSYHDTITPQIEVGSTWSNASSAIQRVTGSTGWAQHTVSLTSHAGQTVTIGFLATSAFGNNEYLDDVSITAQ